MNLKEIHQIFLKQNPTNSINSHLHQPMDPTCWGTSSEIPSIKSSQ